MAEGEPTLRKVSLGSGSPGHCNEDGRGKVCLPFAVVEGRHLVIPTATATTVTTISIKLMIMILIIILTSLIILKVLLL